MRNGIQSFYLSLGEEACFFLQILNIAEKELGFNIEPITAALVCKAQGYLYLNLLDLKDKKNFLVSSHNKILELFTGKKWEYEKVPPSYKPKKNEYVIDEWQNGSFTHFDSDNFHSLQKSNTIQNGKIITRRVFRVI